MTKQEEVLYEALMTTFSGNLRFLSQYDTALYERVAHLSDAISSGAYKERYFLEFIKNNGDFDIYDSHTENYLYSKKPKQYNNQAVRDVNFDSKNTISLFNASYYHQNTTDLSHNKLELFDIGNFQVQLDIAQYKYGANLALDVENKKFKKIDKFLFIGTLLGRHIPKILTKINSTNHFVCEANLEIFRLSLFVCDYSLLARSGKSVVFAIMEDESAFMEKFTLFFQNDMINNQFFKYYSTNYQVDKYFDLIVSSTIDKDPFLFNYRATMKNILNKTITNIKQYKTLDFTKDMDSQFFEDKPIVFVGAGPSLGKNIAWLEQNQDKFIIVAMGAALKRLNSHGIIPDIITSVDPQDGVFLSQFQGLDSSFLAKPIKILAANTHDNVLSRFAHTLDNTFIFETLISFYKDSVAIGGLSVGEATFKILLYLNAKNIYLLGIDLALDSSTGLTHDSSREHQKGFELDKDSLAKKQLSKKQSFSLREDLIFVKGNYHKEVPTTRLFYASLMEYNQAIRSIKKADQYIYNLSKDGAYIEEVEYKDIDTIDISTQKDKKQYIKDLFDFIEQKASIYDKSSYHHLDEKIAKYDVLLELLDDNVELQISSSDELDKQIDRFFNTMYMLLGNYNILGEIILNYYFVIVRFIKYNLNDRDKRFKPKSLKKIQHLYVYQLKSIVNSYKQELLRLSGQ